MTYWLTICIPTEEALKSNDKKGSELELKSASIEDLEDSKSKLEKNVDDLTARKSDLEKTINVLEAEKKKLDK